MHNFGTINTGENIGKVVYWKYCTSWFQLQHCSTTWTPNTAIYRGSSVFNGLIFNCHFVAQVGNYCQFVWKKRYFDDRKCVVHKVSCKTFWCLAKQEVERTQCPVNYLCVSHCLHGLVLCPDHFSESICWSYPKFSRNIVLTLKLCLAGLIFFWLVDLWPHITLKFEHLKKIYSLQVPVCPDHSS